MYQSHCMLVTEVDSYSIPAKKEILMKKIKVKYVLCRSILFDARDVSLWINDFCLMQERSLSYLLVKAFCSCKILIKHCSSSKIRPHIVVGGSRGQGTLNDNGHCFVPNKSIV